mmetsp:Transcript_8057/g.22388  ORF Transcript_8057/g.22388 Transcript_8057/m.22388 type:complete len:240 (+) Transcript_8057:1056-1775(+)
MTLACEASAWWSSCCRGSMTSSCVYSAGFPRARAGSPCTSTGAPCSGPKKPAAAYRLTRQRRETGHRAAPRATGTTSVACASAIHPRSRAVACHSAAAVTRGARGASHASPAIRGWSRTGRRRRPTRLTRRGWCARFATRGSPRGTRCSSTCARLGTGNRRRLRRGPRKPRRRLVHTFVTRNKCLSRRRRAARSTLRANPLPTDPPPTSPPRESPPRESPAACSGSQTRPGRSARRARR